MTLRLAPEKTFLILAIIFGVLFAIITPPFENPDEPNHFFRAYQISDFKFIGIKSENSAGGYIPKQVIQMRNQASGKKILDYFKVKQDLSNCVFTDFRNTALYPPVVYTGQSLGILGAKTFKLPVIWMLYLGRLANLAIFIAIIYFAIKTTPVYKWGFTLLALMPMTLTQAASLSADTMCFALGFFLIAYLLNLALVKKKIKNKEIAFVALISFFIGLCKLAYIFIPFLLILIPAEKFSSKNRYYTSFFSVVLSACIGIFIWALLVKNLYMPMFNYVDPLKQIQTIFFYPQLFIKGFLNSFAGLPLLHSFIGNLGWFNNPLPKWFVVCYLTVLLICALFENKKEIQVSFIQKAITLVIIILSIIAIDVLTYLHWNKVGATKIVGLQGRYFIPFAPLFLLPFYNRKTIMLNSFKKYSQSFLVFFLIFSLILTTFFIVKKYYL